jgi:hypothetical protein
MFAGDLHENNLILSCSSQASRIQDEGCERALSRMDLSKACMAVMTSLAVSETKWIRHQRDRHICTG